MAYASIYLDTRREKQSKAYPVKLRIYHNGERKLYPLDMDLTKEEFDKSYNSLKPKGSHADIRKRLIEKENEAKKVIERIGNFSFGQFERKMFKGLAFGKDVYSYFDSIIEDLEKKGMIGNKTAYQCAKNSFQAFRKKLSFSDISPDFLHEYESWMIQEGKSLTSVGIYTRTLKAVYNHAIEMGDVSRDIYPFGKRKYVVPAPPKVKKALNGEELRKILNHPVDPGSIFERARDFFFLSYSLNGLNIKDIANIKWSNLNMKEKVLTLIREKTRNTSRANQKMLMIPLNDFSIRMIEKYGHKDDEYVFDIYSHQMNAQERFRAAAKFTRFINQHMKTISKEAIGRDEISTYWARHTMATKLLRDGVPISLISESLGHSNMKTTMSYLDGFEDKVKREISESLFNF